MMLLFAYTAESHVMYPRSFLRFIYFIIRIYEGKREYAPMYSKDSETHRIRSIVMISGPRVYYADMTSSVTSRAPAPISPR